MNPSPQHQQSLVLSISKKNETRKHSMDEIQPNAQKNGHDGNLDVAPTEEDDDHDSSSTPSLVTVPTALGGRPRSVQFPWKLHRLLEYCHGEGLEDVVSWDSAGKSFQIHSKARFETEIMPRFFDTNKFKSFQRSLNLWGFYVRNRGCNKSVSADGATVDGSEADCNSNSMNTSTQPNQEQGGECYHPHFVRGQPDLCHQMLRIKKKTTKTRTSRPKSHVSDTGVNKTKKVVTPTTTSDLNSKEDIGKILMDGSSRTTGPVPTNPFRSPVVSSLGGPVSRSTTVVGEGDLFSSLIPGMFPGQARNPSALMANMNPPSMPSSRTGPSDSIHSPAINMALFDLLLKNRNVLNQSQSSLLAQTLAGDQFRARMMANIATSPTLVGSSGGTASMWNSIAPSNLSTLAALAGQSGGSNMGYDFNNFRSMVELSHGTFPPSHRSLLIGYLAQQMNH
ncbi:HSF-type DNA-binding protein [Nitzschia inconspicua]|uniref:HSF-type DNA-binding protein n=1 Tax=Nitzschia inconspicua TaxID=303405 RepID=A0A9K3PFL6_9STRA|nr:HSF-type DNA-binding protein [Nitzschia inconspicua]